MQIKVEELSSAKALLQKDKKNSESEVGKLRHTLNIREGDLHDKQVSCTYLLTYASS